jgi:hypothetical protein
MHFKANRPHPKLAPKELYLIINEAKKNLYILHI